MLELPFRRALRRMPLAHFFNTIRAPRRWEQSVTDDAAYPFASGVRASLLTWELRRRVELMDAMEAPYE